MRDLFLYFYFLQYRSTFHNNYTKLRQANWFLCLATFTTYDLEPEYDVWRASREAREV